jgi:V/A-type H+-transporting ATPase subunit I
MITPMLKFSFLVHHAQYPAFLNQLQELGLVHIETVTDNLSENSEQYLRQLHSVQECKSALEVVKTTKTNENSTEWTNGADLLRAYEQLTKEEAERRRQRKELENQLSIVAPWGDLPEIRLKTLESKGVFLHFYDCVAHDFDDTWRQEFKIEIVRQLHHKIYFFLLTRQPVAPSLHGAELVRFPAISLTALKQRLKEVHQRLTEIREAYKELSADSHLLEDYSDELENLLARENALHQTQSPIAGRLLWLQAWIAKENKGKLLDFLEKKQVVFFEEQPTPDSNVPILLKNGYFARLFQPIGNIFALPDYTELDLTPFFAPFFMLFFGMCLSDVIYGAIIFAVVTFLKHRNNTSLRPLLTLGQFLGAAAIVFGLITGSMGGIDLSKTDIAWLNQMKQYFIQTDSLFNISLIIGLVQILFGMSLKVINRTRMFGWAYGISPLGWILAIFGALLLQFTALTWPAYILLSIGLTGIILFSDPNAGLFKRIGLGLWDLYGVSGLFGDVLSYIRLFALGLSSATLGYVVNTIALSALSLPPVIGELCFLAILLFGHGLNFGISTLSAFVHPIRLTFVEFYKNAGFAGGGQPFKPYKFQ